MVVLIHEQDSIFKVLTVYRSEDTLGVKEDICCLGFGFHWIGIWIYQIMTVYGFHLLTTGLFLCDVLLIHYPLECDIFLNVIT